MTSPETGAEASVELIVASADTAARLGVEAGEAYPEVLATRTMVGEMERAAAKLLRPHLQPGQLSVGVRVEVEAFDPGGRIGHGRHARAVVDEARLLAGAAKRHA